MRTEQIHVENLKCSGCAATIRKALMEMDGVELVEVDPEHAQVEAQVQDDVRRKDMTAKLARLGYPEAGTGNLLQKGISYVSCMIGKVSKE
jgi:copper chaperone CopZ